MPAARFELPPQYDPHAVERPLYRRWLERGVFTARVDASKPPYVIVIPPPNVTAVLHMGQGLNNVTQDVLLRAGPRRNRGAERGGAPRRKGGKEPLRPRPRGVRRAGLGLRERDRQHDPRAAQDDRP